MAFILSVISLLSGPFLYSCAGRFRHAQQILDGFIFITIAGLVCVHIMPASIEAGGIVAIAFMIVGLAFPIVLEYVFDHAMKAAHVTILLLALIGLTVHAAFEGLALLPEMVTHNHDADYDHGLFQTISENYLTFGVILHRLPVGMAIWWSIRPHFGLKVALGTFAIIILGTAASYFSGPAILEIVKSAELSYFQAFVAGSLLHVVIMGVSHDHEGFVLDKNTVKAEWPHRLGCTVGLLFVFMFNMH